MGDFVAKTRGYFIKTGLSVYAFGLYVTLNFAYAAQGIPLDVPKLGVNLIISLAMGLLWGLFMFLVARKRGGSVGV